MANKFRSSFDIKLNGADYTLRPSFDAIMEFNDKSGLDVFEALGKFKDGVSIKIIVSAIWAGIQGECSLQSKEAPSFSKIGEECQAHGFPECVPFAIDFLSRAVASDVRLKKLVGEEAPQ